MLPFSIPFFKSENYLPLQRSLKHGSYLSAFNRITLKKESIVFTSLLSKLDPLKLSERKQLGLVYLFLTLLGCHVPGWMAVVDSFPQLSPEHLERLSQIACPSLTLDHLHCSLHSRPPLPSMSVLMAPVAWTICFLWLGLHSFSITWPTLIQHFFPRHSWEKVLPASRAILNHREIQGRRFRGCLPGLCVPPHLTFLRKLSISPFTSLELPLFYPSSA